MQNASFTKMVLTCIILLIFCACSNHNTDHVYYGKSTTRFDVDYKPQVKSVIRFLNEYTDAYNEAIATTYPRYKDWKILPTEMMLNSKATLYISNTRETLLEFDSTGPKELIVEATDYPIEMAIYAGADVMPPHREPTNPVSEIVHYYDSTVKFFGLGKSSYLSFKDVAFDEPGFAFESLAMVSMEDFTYHIIYDDSVLIQQGFMTNVKGFDSLVDSAASFGRMQADLDVQELFFESKAFRKAMATTYLAPYATYMLKRFEKKEKDIEQYPFDQYQNDVDSLYQIGKQFGVSKEFVDSLYQYTSNTLPDHPALYKNKDDLRLKWIGINAIIFLIIVFFKRKIEKSLESVAWPVGIIQTLNISLFCYFWNVLDYVSLIIPFLIGIVASFYLSWSSTQKKFRL